MTPATPPDDDRTVIRGPSAAASGAAGFMSHTLPVGTQVGGLEITGLIGEGGFGIVYLANDPQLQRQVAVKEYMPSSLAARAQSSLDVSVKSERHRDTFEAGLKSFVNEARLLARFNHPALVKVFRFWEANQTAYMAMPYYEGPTLKAALAALGRPPSEEVLRDWLRPLLDALAVMHRESCYHRDIAPDNILLTSTGPLLLDFGAARRVIGDMTHALTVVLKPGYAPIEQYGESSAMLQGPWTDLYALASVVYCAITGRAPVSSVERLMGDSLEPLSVKAAGFYSASLLHAVDAALAVRPADRPQNVAEFRVLLNEGVEVSDSAASFRASAFDALAPAASGFGASVFGASGFGASTLDAPVPVPPPVPTPTVHAPPAATDRPAPAPAAVTTAAVPAPSLPSPAPTVAARPAPAALPTERSASTGLPAWLIVAGVLAVVAAPAWFFLSRPDAPVTAPPVEATHTTPPVAASVPAVVAPTPTPTPTPVEAAKPEPTPAEPVKAEAVKTEPAKTEPAAVEPAKTETPAAETPKAETPKAEPAAVEPKPARMPRTKATPPVAQPAPAPSHEGTTRPSRCSDILQKASLEPLTNEEAAYLKRECR